MHGVSQLAVFDPQAEGAARVVARHQVDSLPNQPRHVETLLHRGNNFFRRVRPRRQVEIRRRLAVAGAVAGAAKLQLARRIRTTEIVPQNSVFDHHRALRCHAFAVERARPQSAGQQPVIYHRYSLGCDFLSQLIHQERPAQVNGVAGHRTKEVAQQLRRQHRLEHHRNLLRFYLARSQVPPDALHRTPRYFFRRLQFAPLPRRREPVIGYLRLLVTVLAQQV